MSHHRKPAKPRMALSPRTPAPALVSGSYGTTGRAAPSGHTDPTAGRLVAGTPRRAVVQADRRGRTRTVTVTRNTMSRANMGSGVRRAPEASEFARESLTAPSAPTPARVAAGTRYVTGLDGKLRLAGESEGIRQPAMARRSVLTTTGAIDVNRAGPVWLGD